MFCVTNIIILHIKKKQTKKLSICLEKWYILYLIKLLSKIRITRRFFSAFVFIYLFMRTFVWFIWSNRVSIFILNLKSCCEVADRIIQKFFWNNSKQTQYVWWYSYAEIVHYVYARLVSSSSTSKQMYTKKKSNDS